MAAVTALGEMPSLTGCAATILGVNIGVKDGDSTLRLFFGLQLLSSISGAARDVRLTR